MSRATVVLEGITVQHAGELIFEIGSTRLNRQDCRDIYLTALEDFAFAYLFGEQIAVSRKLPKVGNDEPGMQLLNDLPPETILDVEITQSGVGPREMLEKHQHRERLFDCINALPEIVSRDRVLWSQFIGREARAYLGNHSSLQDPALSPHDYVFAKKNQGGTLIDYHMKDSVAESLIDPWVIQVLVDAIKGSSPNNSPVDNALRVFVTRTILTHIQIFIWYRFAAQLTKRVTNVLRVLYPTRSHFETCLRDYQRVRRSLIPHALRLALNKTMTRLEFLANLKDLRSSPVIQEVSGDFGDALKAAAEGKTRVSEDIGRRVLEGVQRVAQDKVQNVTTGTELLTGLSTGLAVSTGFENSSKVLPADSWARLLSGNRFETYTANEYSGELSRVFPELAPR